MKMNTRELRQKRAALIDQAAEAIEDEARFNELKGQINKLDGQIADLEALEKMKAENGVPITRSVEVTLDEADRDFRSDGEFFKAVMTAAQYPSRTDPRLLSRKVEGRATGMSEGVPAEGGYLLSPTLAAKFIEPMWKTGQIMSRVAHDPVGPNSNSIIYNGVDETSRVNGSRKGGITTYWLDEGSTITGSKPKFRQVEIKLRKITALCYATDEQLQDTVNLESWLNRAVPDELRFAAEDAVIEGLGGGQAVGIMSSPSLISVLRTDANKVLYADVYNMWARRYVGVSDYVWLVNQDVMPQIYAFALSGALNTAVFSYSPDGSVRMFGVPVLEVEYCQSMGTAGDILLCSLSQYQTIDRGGVNSASSMHVAFITAEMAFRFIYRFGGAPLWESAVTPLHGSNTVSPFVALTSASS
jgi:HK97 family phage major capsid protein